MKIYEVSQSDDLDYILRMADTILGTDIFDLYNYDHKKQEYEKFLRIAEVFDVLDSGEDKLEQLSVETLLKIFETALHTQDIRDRQLDKLIEWGERNGYLDVGRDKDGEIESIHALSGGATSLDDYYIISDIMEIMNSYEGLSPFAVRDMLKKKKKSFTQNQLNDFNKLEHTFIELYPEIISDEKDYEDYDRQKEQRKVERSTAKTVASSGAERKELETTSDIDNAINLLYEWEKTDAFPERLFRDLENLKKHLRLFDDLLESIQSSEYNLSDSQKRKIKKIFESIDLCCDSDILFESLMDDGEIVEKDKIDSLSPEDQEDVFAIAVDNDGSFSIEPFGDDNAKISKWNDFVDATDFFRKLAEDELPSLGKKVETVLTKKQDKKAGHEQSEKERNEQERQEAERQAALDAAAKAEVERTKQREKEEKQKAEKEAIAQAVARQAAERKEKERLEREKQQSSASLNSNQPKEPTSGLKPRYKLDPKTGKPVLVTPSKPSSSSDPLAVVASGKEQMQQQARASEKKQQPRNGKEIELQKLKDQEAELQQLAKQKRERQEAGRQAALNAAAKAEVERTKQREKQKAEKEAIAQAVARQAAEPRYTQSRFDLEDNSRRNGWYDPYHKNNQNLLRKSLLKIIAAAALTAGAGYYYKNYYNNEQPSKSTNFIPSSVDPSERKLLLQIEKQIDQNIQKGLQQEKSVLDRLAPDISWEKITQYVKDFLRKNYRAVKDYINNNPTLADNLRALSSTKSSNDGKNSSSNTTDKKTSNFDSDLNDFKSLSKKYEKEYGRDIQQQRADQQRQEQEQRQQYRQANVIEVENKTLANGDVYTGKMLWGKPHGKGRLIKPNTDVFFNEDWNEGLMNGDGWANIKNVIYIGDWKDNNFVSGAIRFSDGAEIRSRKFVAVPGYSLLFAADGIAIYTSPRERYTTSMSRVKFNFDTKEYERVN